MFEVVFRFCGCEPHLPNPSGTFRRQIYSNKNFLEVIFGPLETKSTVTYVDRYVKIPLIFSTENFCVQS